MNSSAMIQKSCIQIFLLITWDTCVYSGNVTDLRFWLGCRALIPCQPPSVSSVSFKWFYKVDGESKEILLFSQDESGVVRYDASHRRLNVMPNHSLVIDNFTARDQGMYWCENCKKDIGSGKSSIIFRVQKEILNEIQKTFLITAGRSFTQTCSGEFPDLKWTFETSKTVPKSERRPETVTETTNKSIHIAVVKNADAGKYTCWARRCGGPSQKLLTVNLCVLKIHHGEDSPLSCVVTCDVDLNNLKHISSLLIDNTTSVDVGPSGSLICNASQVTYGHTTATSKYIPSTKAGESGKTEHLMPVLCGVSVVVACLFIITFLIFCLKSRWRTAFPFCRPCCGFSKKEEEGPTVIYSSVVIKTPANKRNNHTAESDCLYSDIKV